MDQDVVVKLSNLVVSYAYGLGREKTALKGVDLEIRRGETLGLLGPNGAGKTTLIKSILGFIGIRSGSVALFGHTPPRVQDRRRIGYMPEVANYYWFLTPEEILTMLGGIAGMKEQELRSRIGYVLDITGLSGNRRELIKNFSKGMQGRLNIAQALLHDPELLILDEPFSGLDPLGRIHVRAILKRLKDEKKTVFLSSHELSEAELICDYVTIMKDGLAFQRSPLADLLARKGEHTLEKYFLQMIGGSYE